MYCIHCGVQNSDAAKFCRSCGKSLEEEVQLVDPVDGVTSTEVVKEKNGEETDTVKEQQSYDGQLYYGTGQSYGGQPPYGTGQPYGNQQSYGTGQPYGAGQTGYDQNGYGYQPHYEVESRKKQKKKKGKKGIVIVLIVVLFAALAGGGTFLYIKESDPVAPVINLFEGATDFDLEKIYDSIYWGDKNSSGWVSREEFIQEMSSNMEDELGLMQLMSLDHLDFKITHEGEAYEGDDGLIRKEITVEVSVELIGKDVSQELGDIVIVKSGKKFLFIPVWKLDYREMESFF